MNELDSRISLIDARIDCMQRRLDTINDNIEIVKDELNKNKAFVAGIVFASTATFGAITFIISSGFHIGGAA